MRRNFRLATNALWAPLLCLPALAVNPDRLISQYAHTAWRMQDGSFGGTPWVIDRLPMATFGLGLRPEFQDLMASDSFLGSRPEPSLSNRKY